MIDFKNIVDWKKKNKKIWNQNLAQIWKETKVGHNSFLLHPPPPLNKNVKIIKASS